MSRGYVIICPNCGNAQSCLVRDVTKYKFKCFNCNKINKFRNKLTGYTLIHWGPYKSELSTKLACSSIKSRMMEEKLNGKEERK